MEYRSRQRAFTLIELLLALAIAIILVALAAPSMRGLSAGSGLHATCARLDEFAPPAPRQARPAR